MAAKPANPTIAAPPPENPNAATVRSLYEALSFGNHRNISSLIADDLEWWFHGPQDCHYMMKKLTGKSSPSDFRFRPRSIDGVDGDRVVAEGWEGAHVYWVHVWTLKDGVIAQFREYYNTWLTVQDMRRPAAVAAKCAGATTTLWRSHPRDHVGKRSMPELMLAI